MVELQLIVTRDVYIRQSSYVVWRVIMSATMWHRDRIQVSPGSGYVLDGRVSAFPACPYMERVSLVRPSRLSVVSK